MGKIFPKIQKNLKNPLTKAICFGYNILVIVKKRICVRPMRHCKKDTHIRQIIKEVHQNAQNVST